jgi:hypothetical protein
MFHLKLVMVDQIHHNLEGVALQIPSKLSQPSFDCPVSPFGRISTELSELEVWEVLGALETQGLFDPNSLLTPARVWLLGLFGVGAREEAPVLRIGDNGFRGVFTAAAVEGPMLSSAIPMDSSDSMYRSSIMWRMFEPWGWFRMEGMGPLVLVAILLQTASLHSLERPRPAHWWGRPRHPPCAARMEEVLASFTLPGS